MTVKKLEGEERFEAHKLFVYCFHQRVDNIENERQKQEAETQEDWGAFDDDGKLMPRIINNHYDFLLAGQAVTPGGIGGVATYPGYRETGAIREIFKALLLEAYKNGEVLSALFPFNH
ncbi:MAG: GNAT family N-acetyltransferase, partial [Treponema sp.]|nr:GNAT family N-acetyltransferase [Treponema sp.]